MSNLLKFITCGSVDDGKSTLIGHMLYNAKLLFTDQEKSLELDSRLGNRDGKLDYSLLLDGLMAEREQGITIDVAYRFFATEKRSFIVADCPGHEQYTRNMAVGAAFADLAVILVDATKGVLMQTRRHTRICSLMGIRHFVLAVNKIDLVSYDKRVFHEICDTFNNLISEMYADSVYALPVCATDGDNITMLSKHTLWHKGLPLLPYLEQIDAYTIHAESGKFIMPVQRVCRPNHTFRGFQGQVERGLISVGDEITILPGREKALVKSIYIADKVTNTAFVGQPLTIQIDRDVDVSRGNVLTTIDSEAEVSGALTAAVLWLESDELIPGRHFWLKCGTATLPAVVMAIKYKIDVSSGKHIVADTLHTNELAVCDISLSENMVFDSFENNKALGSFILINRMNNMTSACGTILHSLRRSSNVIWKDTDVSPDMRAGAKGQKVLTLWFTGLSGSGKTVLANALEKRLFAMGKHTMLLDGDNLRHGLNKNLGFEEHDRVENIRRTAEVAKLLNDAGIVVFTSLISPYESDRINARDIIGEPFRLVYVRTPLEVCEGRDAKGLYAKARRGQIPNFTGVTAVYEAPKCPNLIVDTSDSTVDDIVEILINTFFGGQQ